MQSEVEEAQAAKQAALEEASMSDRDCTKYRIIKEQQDLDIEYYQCCYTGMKEAYGKQATMLAERQGRVEALEFQVNEYLKSLHAATSTINDLWSTIRDTDSVKTEDEELDEAPGLQDNPSRVLFGVPSFPRSVSLLTEL